VEVPNAILGTWLSRSTGHSMMASVIRIAGSTEFFSPKHKISAEANVM